MGSTIGPSSSGLRPQYQQLIRRTLQVESQPKVDLENQREEEKNTKSLVSDLDGKLSSLQSQLGTLTDTTSSPFEGRSVSVEGGTEAFSASADKTASTGSHSLSVDRLASKDGRVSQTYDADGSNNTNGPTLSNFFANNGAQTFDVEVATPTDSNPDARTSLSVTVDSNASTNEGALKDIRSAIDDTFQTAVDNGTISSDERPDVSVVNPTSDTARLSLRSSQTGYRGRLGLTDSSDGLLAELGGSDNQLEELTTVGNSEKESSLTSKFTLDGLTLERNSNKVDDALDGVTINLEEATGTESSFEVTVDDEGAKSVVEEFVNRVNEVMEFLREKTDIDPESGERGPLADDSTFQRLERQLRTDATQPVSGQPDALETLADIGVEANRDGTLKFADEGKLSTALRENQGALKDLFSGPDGVATRMETRVDQYVDAGGLLDSREESIDSTVDRLDDRIEQFDERLERRQQQLRDQYSQVQSTIRSIANQQQALGFV